MTELLADSAVTDVAWSPDGQTIAFTAQASGLAESHVYALDIATSAITRLTQPGTSYEHPSWSPDGSQVVFSSPAALGFHQIKRMEADGSGVVTLTDAILTRLSFGRAYRIVVFGLKGLG